MISTHILDTSLGHPAQGVSVQLEILSANSQWTKIAADQTNADGRVSFQCSATAGTYRLLFEVETYFKKREPNPFFTNIPVIFKVTDTTRKYHVPLLLNPYGYSTYRGS